MSDPLMKVEGLTKRFPVAGRTWKRQKETVKAVSDVSFTVEKGETLGLVGESGCGKSTTGRMLLGLTDPSEGSVFFNGESVHNLSGQHMRWLRRHIQMIFQDPYASLNPSHTVGYIIEQPLKVHTSLTKKERREQVIEILETVGLKAEHVRRYPHQFSGGQRQRIGIARALVVHPQLIIADEPVSALDVSVQAQVLNLLRDLQQAFSLTYIFIAHDLSVIRHISDRVGVMYLGRLVEIGDSEAFYREPLHPYTQALLSAVPVPDPDENKEQIVLSGDVPSAIHPPSGCEFHTRCPFAMPICSQVRPVLQPYGEQRSVACHLYHDV